jgi:hypothetical protein
MKSELADDYNLPARFEHRAIHDSLFVIENAQSRNLAAQPFDVLGGIGLFDAQEDEQACLNGGFGLPGDDDAGG